MKAVLVFDIEEKIFKDIEKTSDLDICFKWNQDIRYVSKKKLYVPKEKHIKNYSLKQLPKGHGRLKDIDKIEQLLDLDKPNNMIAKSLKNLIDSVPTIIDAESEE